MRYPRLYASFLRFSFSKAMEFRFDFFFRIGMDVLWYITNLAFFQILYSHTSLFGGWTQDQILIFQAAMFFSDALYMTVLSSNMWWFPFLINKGDLDYYLVRPVSSLFFLSLREFSANSFVNLLMTVAFLVYVLVAYPPTLGAGSILLFVALLFVGLVLQWALQLCALIPVFWTHQGMGLREVSFALSRYSHQPDGIYRGWVRRVLTSILPYALIVSFPCRALFDDNPWPATLQLLAVTCVLIGVAVLFWKRGLRAYASASS